MARQPKPWYRADRKVWCVTINGQRHNLGPTKKGAFERFYALMRQPCREKVGPPGFSVGDFALGIQASPLGLDRRGPAPPDFTVASTPL